MSEHRHHEELDMTTVASSALDVSPLPTGVFHLAVIDGPDAGTSFRLDPAHPSPVSIGQSPACDFRLSDQHVSRRHAQLEHEGKRLRFTDLQSKNGTFINGLTVLDALLWGGEVIQIGETAIQVDHHPTDTEVQLPLAASFGRFVGASTEVRRLYPMLARLAGSHVPVVIEGETGTGKEALAEAIHERGRRADGPLVVFDCTAVPPNLVESELFGHERGAFTGADTTRQGVFEQARGGTLLIDEIGDLPLDLQPKLLRVIDREQVRRVGSNASGGKARPGPWHASDRRKTTSGRRVRAGLRRDDPRTPRWQRHACRGGRGRGEALVPNHQGAGTKVALGIPIAQGGDARVGITLDGTHVYWTDEYAHTVKKVALGGGSATLLGKDVGNCYKIVVDDASVHFTGPQWEYRITPN